MVPAQPSSIRSSSRALEQHIRGHKIVQSTGEAWADIEVQIFQRAHEEMEVLVPAVAETLLVWIISGEALVEERDLDGEWHGSVVKPGSFYLTQAQSPYLMRWKAAPEQPFEVMHLYLGPEMVSRAALSLKLNPARTRMQDVSGGHDIFVSNLLAGLRDELRVAHCANRLFITGLVDSLSVHLLRHHAEAFTAKGRKPALLPAWKLRRSLDHMEAHLTEPFDLDCLAALCAMSRYHFSRAFHNTVGQSPSRWFIQRRMAHAKENLRSTDISIVDIAASVGYGSPSHFAKIFRAETQMSPKEYRSI